MPVIIEILIFFGVVGSVIWAGIKSTARTVSNGVKERMNEREELQPTASRSVPISEKLPEISHNRAINDYDDWSDLIPANKERRLLPNRPRIPEKSPPTASRVALGEDMLIDYLTKFFSTAIDVHFKKHPIENSPIDSLLFLNMIATMAQKLKSEKHKSVLVDAFGADSDFFDETVDKVCETVIKTFVGDV